MKNGKQEENIMKKNYLACKRAIEEAITKHFNGYYLNQESVMEVLDKYHFDDVSFVLACTLYYKNCEKHFSKNNLEWARNYISPEFVCPDYVVGIHPAILSEFVDFVRQQAEELDELVYWFPEAKKYLHIQTTDDGYDYTFYEENYKELDGGVFDDPDCSIGTAIQALLEDEGITGEKYHLDIDQFLEKVEAAWEF